MNIQDRELVISAVSKLEGDKPVNGAFYQLVLDSEKKIIAAYDDIKAASGKKDYDAIADAQKTIRDQLQFNAYQIKKTEIQPDLATMAENYYQSIQALARMFDDAYMHNVGKGDYKTIQARMQEAEGKSDEYYALFMQELKKTNLEVYQMIKTINED